MISIYKIKTVDDGKWRWPEHLVGISKMKNFPHLLVKPVRHYSNYFDLYSKTNTLLMNSEIIEVKVEELNCEERLLLFQYLLENQTNP